MKRIYKILLGIGAISLLANCGDSGESFSLLSDQDIFEQNVGASNDKVDILWVVDNSGSMASSQADLASNFNSFIADFETKNLDFKMAVTGTDSYKAGFVAEATNCAPFRDGPLDWAVYDTFTGQWIYDCLPISGATYSGYNILTPLTPSLAANFVTNVTLGVLGSGDERPFQSIVQTMDDASSAGFLRNDSFLAVIIITDEDDFSRDVLSGSAPLHPVSDYVTYLDNLTGTSGATARYNVHAISILDEPCRAALYAANPSTQMVSTRVPQLANDTGGIVASLCDDFATELSAIADNILSLATQFTLSRIPIPETIVVKINGVDVPEAATNPGPTTGGWTYIPASNAIQFSGDHIPAAGSIISVDFDPVSYGG